MNPGTTNRYKWSAVVAVLVLIFCSWYPPIQELANDQIDAGLKRAAITFASARTINGLISVLQGTELAVQPLGMGVTLTVGQILDPINDLVEQFSSLMLFASVAFGVQKMLLVIGGHAIVSALVTAIALLWAGLLFTGRNNPWLTQLVLILFMIRFAMPVAAIGTDLAFQKLMSKDYASSRESLQMATVKIETLTPKSPEAAGIPAPGASAPSKGKGLLDRMKESVEGIKDSVSARIPSIDYERIKMAVVDLPERIIKLIVIFLMQTIVLPLLLVWGLYVLIKGSGTMRGQPPPESSH